MGQIEPSAIPEIRVGLCAAMVIPAQVGLAVSVEVRLLHFIGAVRQKPGERPRCPAHTLHCRSAVRC